MNNIGIKVVRSAIVLMVTIGLSAGVLAKPEGNQGGGGDKRPSSSYGNQNHKEKSLEKAPRREREEDSAAGLEKQRDRKADQEQKELGQGSEQGQAAREEHSRKWWKFWGE